MKRFTVRAGGIEIRGIGSHAKGLLAQMVKLQKHEFSPAGVIG